MRQTHQSKPELQCHNFHQPRIIPKSDRKSKSQLPSTKNKTAENKKSGIYQISCGTKNCNQKYNGQTARTLNSRFVEHLTAFKNNHPDQSSIKNQDWTKSKSSSHTHIQHQQLETLERSQR
jgi:hypothetical protein